MLNALRPASCSVSSARYRLFPVAFARHIGGPGATEHGNDPETIEKEKHKNLKGDQDRHSEPMPEHAPGWNQKLASSSEAGVKADKHDKSAEDLQEETSRHAETDRSGKR